MMRTEWKKRLIGLALLLSILCAAVGAQAETWVCPACGQSNEYNFCSSCGQARPTAAPQRYCGNCGMSLAGYEGARFCPNCGAVLTDGVAAATAAPASTRPSSEIYSWYDESTRYYYQQLSEQEKRLFALVYDGMMRFEETIEIPDGFTIAMYERVYDALHYDCPELFQQRGTTYQYRNATNEITSVMPKYCLTAAEFAQSWQKMKTQIEGLRALPGFGASDYSKESTIYRYIIEHCEYLLNEPYTIYADAVYCRGYAQCSGYARALNLALRYYGIPCLLVTGKTYTDGVLDDERGHEWSIVRLDGQWYQCDATFDDPVWQQSEHPESFPPSGNAYLQYLNVTDAFMLESRTMDDHGFILPSCVSWTDNYTVREGIFVPAGTSNLLRAVQNAIIARRDQGLKQIAISFESRADYQNCKDHLNEGILANLKRASDYRWWYNNAARFLYIIVP